MSRNSILSWNSWHTIYCKRYYSNSDQTC